MELHGAESVSWQDRVKAWASAVVAMRWHIMLALAIAAAPGHFLFPRIIGKPGIVFDNQLLVLRDRWLGVLCVILSVVVAGLLFAFLHFLRKKRDPETTWEASLRLANLRAFPLLALPLLGSLAVPAVERDHPWFVVVACALLAGIAVAYVASLPSRPLPRLKGAGLIVGLLVVGYGLVFSYFSIRQHHAFGTHTFDLGIYNHLFWNNIHGRWLASTLVRGGNHVAAHFDPILVLLSPIYALHPRAETILVLQSFCLALGAIPLYLLAKRKLESPWLAVALALVYLLYPAMHGANLYDFHSLSLAAPLLLGMMAALELGAQRTYWALLAVALLVREDVSLMVVGIGLYAILVHRRGKLGRATILAAVVYLLVVKLFVMPDPGLFMKSSKETYGYAYYYRDLMGKDGARTGDLLASLISNPLFLLKLVGNEKKLLFFFQLFLPLLFLPLVAGRRIVAMAYGLAFLFLSSREPVHSIHFQYSTVLYPFLMAMVPLVLAELRTSPRVARLFARPERLPAALVAGMIVASLVLGAKFGPLLPNASFHAGFTPFVFAAKPDDREALRWLEEKLAAIPPEASVAVTSRLGGHATSRDLVCHFGNDADYLLVHDADLKRRERQRLSAMLARGYQLVDEHGPLRLYARSAEGKGETRPEGR